MPSTATKKPTKSPGKKQAARKPTRLPKPGSIAAEIAWHRITSVRQDLTVDQLREWLEDEIDRLTDAVHWLQQFEPDVRINDPTVKAKRD